LILSGEWGKSLTIREHKNPALQEKAIGTKGEVRDACLGFNPGETEFPWF
jgi:hypothetical protein